MPGHQDAFNSGQMDIIINDSFADLGYMVYLLQYDSIASYTTIKAENGKLVISGRPSSTFQEQDGMLGSTHIK